MGRSHILTDIKLAIRNDIAAIPPKMLVRAMERLKECIPNGGNHLLEIILRVNSLLLIRIFDVKCLYARVT